MITTTMKKEYIAPETVAHVFQIHQPLLNASANLDALITEGDVVDITPSGDPMPDVEGGDNVFNGREFDFDEDF